MMKYFLLVLLVLAMSWKPSAVASSDDQLCHDNAVDVIESLEPEFIECGEWWGDCGAGQEVGAGCIVECDDGSSDAVFIHCEEVECKASHDGVSARWEIVKDVGCALCRQNAADVVEAHYPDLVNCEQSAGDCGAGQHVGAECSVHCQSQNEGTGPACQDLKCHPLGGQVAAMWEIMGEVDCVIGFK